MPRSKKKSHDQSLADVKTQLQKKHKNTKNYERQAIAEIQQAEATKNKDQAAYQTHINNAIQLLTLARLSL